MLSIVHWKAIQEANFLHFQELLEEYEVSKSHIPHSTISSVSKYQKPQKTP